MPIPQTTNTAQVQAPLVAGPTAASERLPLLDVLRGFALFGILVANILSFSGYLLLPPQVARSLGTASADRVALFVIRALVEGKFYSTFAFLFGVGFVLQLERSDEAGTSLVPRYVRRLACLFLMGIAHAVLLEWGDILSVYAMTGALLLPFRNGKPKNVLLWAVCLLGSPILLYGTMLLTFHGYDPTGPKLAPRELAQVVGTYATGTYREIFPINLLYLKYRWVDLLYSSRFPKVLGMFLLGFYAQRVGMFQRPFAHASLLGRVMRVGFVVGLAANSALAVLMSMDVYHPPSRLGLLETVVYSVGVPSLSLSYIAMLSLLWERPPWRRVLGWLAAPGRMALTNYIGQTVLCLLIFYGYGLGLFGRLGPSATTALAAAIFGFQVIFSRWWLHHFTFGPLEVALRAVTYWRWV